MRGVFAVALLVAAGVARAQELDLQALSLKGSAPQTAPAPRAWQLFLEGGTGYSEVRNAALTNQTRAIQRLSADLHIDATPLPGLRTVLSTRLDYADWPYQIEPNRATNTLTSYQGKPPGFAEAS
ncbi:hypothetical protein [Ralstonia pseudosolanacearum]|uniref:hypothetical protein n=1 Tax=Ralstonia pseudosolanacearum TaxID=1310165 RepID=UPI001FF982D9|nr:hypothetical protein [Ralstonia pseudosolanacearum]